MAILRAVRGYWNLIVSNFAISLQPSICQPHSQCHLPLPSPRHSLALGDGEMRDPGNGRSRYLCPRKCDSIFIVRTNKQNKLNIKKILRDSTVYLPERYIFGREISRATRFLIMQGVVVKVEVTEATVI